jgi:hypothetical protein
VGADFGGDAGVTIASFYIPPRVLDIATEIAWKHRVLSSDILKSRNRSPAKRRARFELCARLRTMSWGTGHPSYPQIAHWLGVHHTSIIYAERRYYEELEKENSGGA